jgi:SAM-dependent methyltransferase
MTTKDVDFNKDYWNSFYKNFQRHTPSQFCVSVITDLAPGSVIVELGSGNGRDAHYFASQGFITVAMDLSSAAISSCKEYAKSNGILHSLFFQGDLTDKDAIQRTVSEARSQSVSGSIVFYSRFVMHSIDDEQQQRFLEALSPCVGPSDAACFEFRSKEDAVLDKHYGGHFRRYVDTESFERALSETVKLTPEYSITGQGMAKFKEEDPFVSRIIAKKYQD